MKDNLNSAYESATVLPDGAYFDDDEMLRSKDGQLLPDDTYKMPDGSMLLYEGNFLNMALE